jgi:hypothetical protein
MTRTTSSLHALALALASSAHAQSAPAPVAGYARDLSGAVMEYDSALPEVHSALLVRSRKAEHSVAWETAPVPLDASGEHVSFAWLFGMDVDSERHRFELALDGRAWLAIDTPPVSSLETWEIAGPQGSKLVLRPTRLDRHGDLFGFATLELPRALVVPGKTLHLEVSGDDSGSNIWYMTFRGAPRESARLLPVPAVLRRGNEGLQPLSLEVVHLGQPGEVAIESSFGAPQRERATLGFNRFELLHPAVSERKREHVRIAIAGGASYELDCEIAPVRPWTIHLVQHAHTDIGYTRPQTEILPEHLRYLDYALDFCDATDALPEDARFRWTCEASYPLAEYLKSRPPGQIERLRKRVIEGRIELTGMFANLSELLDERSCAASLEPLRQLRENGIPCATAMQDDVNGIAWCYADFLPELGVRYLEMGEHGHRALVPFDVPTAFWWESPAGKRLLAFRADHYMTGNFWGLQSGRFESVEPELFRYLRGLEERGYPFERVAVQYSGVFIDNSPPAASPCEFIRAWNERYVSPHLRSSTVSEFLRWVEKEHGSELPVQHRAWPDWWSDGVGSAPRETAAARNVQARLSAVETLLALDRRLGAEIPRELLRRVDSVRERLVMYGEHTYGAAESISDPLCENSVVQWAEKAAYVWDAVKETALVEEAAQGLLQARLARAEVPTISIVNTRAETCSNLARVFIDRELLPPGRDFRVVGPDGARVPAQLLARLPEGAWWGLWVSEVPPLGYRTYRLELQPGAAVEPAASGEPTLLENRFYRLRVDAQSGIVTSLFDKQLGLELADANASFKLGQLVHEQLSNRSQLERRTLEGCTRTALPIARVERGANGPIWHSLVLHGSAPICPENDALRLEIRLYETGKRVEFDYRVRKRESNDPESLYAAFTFALEGARASYATIGGVVDPTRDQIPGTSADWQAAQGYVALENDKARVLLSSRENLLVQLGGLNVGRYQPVARVEKPAVFAWLLNNYWVTNFLASQGGELRWSFALTSGAPASSPASALRFGLDERVPLLARVLPPAQPNDARAELSLLSFSAPNVLLVGAWPEREAQGIVLEVREVEGRAAQLRVSASGRDQRLQRVDALGAPLGEPADELPLAPHEAAFVRL